MVSIEEYLRNKPDFLKTCKCDGYNMLEVCSLKECDFFDECEEYFAPIARALEEELTEV